MLLSIALQGVADPAQRRDKADRTTAGHAGTSEAFAPCSRSVSFFVSCRSRTPCRLRHRLVGFRALRCRCREAWPARHFAEAMVASRSFRVSFSPASSVSRACKSLVSVASLVSASRWFDGDFVICHCRVSHLRDDGGISPRAFLLHAQLRFQSSLSRSRAFRARSCLNPICIASRSPADCATEVNARMLCGHHLSAGFVLRRSSASTSSHFVSTS